MFFFFVGGFEQQARQVLKSGVGRCIACGSPADLVEYEKVLKLFFVPVWRWPGKEPVMNCKDCNLFFPQSLSPPPPPPRLPEKEVVEAALKCQFCARKVDAAFRFCPFCGSALWIVNLGFYALGNLYREVFCLFELGIYKILICFCYFLDFSLLF